MKLYDIDYQIRALWEKIIDQDGELTQEDIEALETLEVAKDKKIKGYGLIIRESIAEIGVIKAEIDRLNKLLKTKQSKTDWLTSNLSRFMHDNQMNEYKSLEVNITFRPSKQLYIEDESTLAKKWFKTEKVTKIDRQAIKDFISKGGKVKGCQIVEKQNIQIK